jgi:AraC-like DNA-binding protein
MRREKVTGHTMPRSTPSTDACNYAHYWRSPLLPGGDLVTARYSDQVFTPHWHDHFVIPIVEAGAQSYLYRGQTHVAGPGGMAIINAGEVHTAQRAHDAGWAYRAFYPSMDFMQGIAQDMNEKNHHAPWFAQSTIHDAQVASQLLEAHRFLQNGADALTTQTLLINAFTLLLSRYADVRPSAGSCAPDARRVAQMQAVLAEDISTTLTLQSLGQAVGLSPFHAARLFARHTGMAPHAWRNQLRLNRARELLRQGVSVADVAVWCGFTDQSHFTKHFKRAYGVAPGVWKKS